MSLSKITDAQPWILKVGGKTGKKFRGIREGGVGEYASFYVFAHATDGAIEAYPLHEWYNFQPIQRYKALSAEEAEQEFGRRNKTMNYFSLMMRSRLKGEDADLDDPDESKSKLKLGGIKKGREFKISDADELMDSDDMSDSSDDEIRKKEDSDDDSKKKKKGGKPKKSKKKQNSDDEAFEESDDGDSEGKEMDYMESSSDESDVEKDPKGLGSVAEEDGLRKLLDSDESSDEENKSSDESNKEEKNKEKDNNDNNGNKQKKKPKPLKKAGDDKKESLSDLSSDSSDSDTNSKKMSKLLGNSASNSRSASPSMDSLLAGSSGIKRKIVSMPADSSCGNSNGASENSNSPTVTPAKKARYDAPAVPASFAGVISSNRELVFGFFNFFFF